MAIVTIYLSPPPYFADIFFPAHRERQFVEMEATPSAGP